MPASFFDSNVLLYLASADRTKADRAEAIVGESGGAISVQVLNEIANVARRKMQMSWPDARAFLSLVRAVLEVHPVTSATHAKGLDLAERYGLSVYDAMIAASALECGAAVLWSEDMQDGLMLEGRVRISNPFRTPG